MQLFLKFFCIVSLAVNLISCQKSDSSDSLDLSNSTSPENPAKASNTKDNEKFKSFLSSWTAEKTITIETRNKNNETVFDFILDFTKNEEGENQKAFARVKNKDMVSNCQLTVNLSMDNRNWTLLVKNNLRSNTNSTKDTGDDEDNAVFDNICNAFKKNEEINLIRTSPSSFEGCGAVFTNLFNSKCVTFK